ncbi:MAG: hypothetical protein JWO32_1302 [Bacteroidetes bacterium]|nr:hypothetical protein [Bacteroidota bacterium]
MQLKKYLFFLCICLNTFVNGQDTSLVSLGKKEVTLINWQLYYIQNPNSTFENTAPVKIKHSEIPVDSIDRKHFSGVCWFRKIIKVDSIFPNSRLSVRLSMVGAAEIFINKKRIATAGTVSSNEDSEFLINTQRYVFSYDFKKDSVYEILIRYSNHALESSYSSGGNNSFGVSMEIANTEDTLNDIMRDRLSNSNFGTMFFVFFMTLFLVHLAIFLFNRKDRSNLFYSLFCLFVSTLVAGLFAYRFTCINSILQVTGLFIIISPIFIFTILPYMLRAFFSLPPLRWYRAIVITAFICIASFIFSFPYHGLLMLLLVIIGSVEALRSLILAFKLRKKGVKIIGTGLVLFTLSLLIASLGIYYAGKHSSDNQVFGIIYLLIFFTGILSIPISITIFLAYTISFTNRSLANKLIEVEKLSARSIEQEREKQLLLASQNEMLERQVTERTYKITEQKKIIEEKNKDIIDSINYAKRIQAAMLPQEEEFKSVFNDSFVFYQPRDIVSGDFYYVTELKGQKLIIAADCTGHGVPGALMSMVGSNIINKLTHENKIVDPKLLLESLHTQLRQALKQDQKGSSNRDGMDVAAVLITEKEIIYSGANRSLIYFDNDNILREIKPTKTAIGGSHIENITIEQHHVPINKVKQFFLFSDGFADQFGGPDGKKLMVSKFKQWLIQIAPLPLKEQQHFLSDQFKSWKKDTEQVDDVMVIGIRV